MQRLALVAFVLLTLVGLAHGAHKRFDWFRSKEKGPQRSDITKKNLDEALKSIKIDASDSGSGKSDTDECNNKEQEETMGLPENRISSGSLSDLFWRRTKMGSSQDSIRRSFSRSQDRDDAVKMVKALKHQLYDTATGADKVLSGKIVPYQKLEWKLAVYLHDKISDVETASGISTGYESSEGSRYLSLFIDAPLPNSFFEQFKLTFVKRVFESDEVIDVMLSSGRLQEFLTVAIKRDEILYISGDTSLSESADPVLSKLDETKQFIGILPLSENKVPPSVCIIAESFDGFENSEPEPHILGEPLFNLESKSEKSGAAFIADSLRTGFPKIPLTFIYGHYSPFMIAHLLSNEDNHEKRERRGSGSILKAFSRSISSNALDASFSKSCDIIIDDISSLTSPRYDPGVLSKAINQKTATGSIYLSSPGNYGHSSSKQFIEIEFDFSTQPEFYQTVHIKDRSNEAYVVLEWSKRDTIDLDLLLLDNHGSIVTCSASQHRVSETQYEVIRISPNMGTGEHTLIVSSFDQSQVPTTFSLLSTSHAVQFEMGTKGSLKPTTAASNAIVVAFNDQSSSEGPPNLRIEGFDDSHLSIPKPEILGNPLPIVYRPGINAMYGSSTAVGGVGSLVIKLKILFPWIDHTYLRHVLRTHESANVHNWEMLNGQSMAADINSESTFIVTKEVQIYHPSSISKKGEISVKEWIKSLEALRDSNDPKEPCDVIRNVVRKDLPYSFLLTAAFENAVQSSRFQCILDAMYYTISSSSPLRFQMLDLYLAYNIEYSLNAFQWRKMIDYDSVSLKEHTSILISKDSNSEGMPLLLAKVRSMDNPNEIVQTIKDDVPSALNNLVLKDDGSELELISYLASFKSFEICGVLTMITNAIMARDAVPEKYLQSLRSRLKKSEEFMKSCEELLNQVAPSKSFLKRSSFRK